MLVAEASDLTPGRAVDLGCGEGGDAIWLAERGWQVTAIDFSEAGLRKAAEHAAERGVADRIEFRQADLRTWSAGRRAVGPGHLLLPAPARPRDARAPPAQMAAAVAPGGTLLVAGHHPDDEHTGLRWSMPGVMFTADELAPAVDPDAVRRPRGGAHSAPRPGTSETHHGHRRGAGSGQDLTAIRRTLDP